MAVMIPAALYLVTLHAPYRGEAPEGLFDVYVEAEDYARKRSSLIDTDTEMFVRRMPIGLPGEGDLVWRTRGGRG